jgi:hypothetical protein
MSIFKGWLGELKTSLKMKISLNRRKYSQFDSTILPSSNGTTQIDHILISKFGIFLIETKNTSGWIFGSEKDIKWTQVLFGHKYKFQNPLRQTYRQRRILAEFLSISESLIHPVIYFNGECKIKTPLPLNVITSNLTNYIKGFTETKLSKEEISRVKILMENYKNHTSLTSMDHINSLKIRHESISTCPSCGDDLKMRTAKKGKRIGNQFYGCKSYPQCTYSKSA